jgi:hypothetical protein
MKLGIMQPYFMPYIGYWQLMAAVDTYVIYDDVNYIKKGWINRNNILVNNDKQMFTISLNGASQNKLINEITIADDFTKLRKTIHMAYHRAPYYNDVMALLDKIFSYQSSNLADFIANSIELVCQYLDIQTKIIMSSDIEKDNSLKGQDKILEICKLLNADTYYNAIGGQELYDKSVFEKENIKLCFLKSDIPEYSQYKNAFVPGLSIIDVLMFNNPMQVNKMLIDYILV